jgi:hypothetical protein
MKAFLIIYSRNGEAFQKNRQEPNEFPITSFEIMQLANNIYDLRGGVLSLKFSVNRLKQSIFADTTM